MDKNVTRLEAKSAVKKNPNTGLQPAKIRFIGNYTLEPIVDFLKFQFLELGRDCKASFADLDTYDFELMSPTSDSHLEEWDLIAISLVMDHKVESQLYEDPVAFAEKVTSLLDSFMSRQKAPVFLTTSFYSPTLPDQSLSDYWLDFKGKAFKATTILQKASTHIGGGFYYQNLDETIGILGLSQAMDTRMWYYALQPFKDPLLSQLARTYKDILRQETTSRKKVLVLDCDNTLWGGIIGEDLLDGIKLGPSSFPGNVYYDFQKMILHLKNQGVILAICSKNNQEDVEQVFRDHPNCLLNLDDFVCIKANWQDKAQNLKEIAQTLNLGLDAFVFVDDSDTEIGLVSSLLPEVEVFQVPKQITSLPHLFWSKASFEKKKTTAEDQEKTLQYQQEARRQRQSQTFDNIDDFYRSLDIKVKVWEAQSNDLQRVSDLFLKTNQFNLTTIRYQRKDVEAIREGPDSAVFCLRVEDKHGDYGLTGVAVVRARGETLTIDSLLMSCRILGKSIENKLLDEVIKTSQKKFPGITKVVARYEKTAKNHQVAKLYDQYGFSIEEESEAAKTYAAPLSSLRIVVPSFLQGV